MSQKSKWEYFKAIYQRYRKATWSPRLPLQPVSERLRIEAQGLADIVEGKMPSSFELIHSSASRKRFSLARDGLKK